MKTTAQGVLSGITLIDAISLYALEFIVTKVNTAEQILLDTTVIVNSRKQRIADAYPYVSSMITAAFRDSDRLGLYLQKLQARIHKRIERAVSSRLVVPLKNCRSVLEERVDNAKGRIYSRNKGPPPDAAHPKAPTPLADSKQQQVGSVMAGNDSIMLDPEGTEYGTDYVPMAMNLHGDPGAVGNCGGVETKDTTEEKQNVLSREEGAMQEMAMQDNCEAVDKMEYRELRRQLERALEQNDIARMMNLTNQMSRWRETAPSAE
jgi:hypothetical protein